MDAVTLVTWRVPAADAAALEVAGLPEAGLEERLRAMRSALGATGLAYLATCQRVVWVVQDAGEDAALRLVRAYQESWDRHPAPPEVLTGFEAFRHLCLVASSLDALVPGEPQVLGQVRAAVQRCDEAGVLGNDLRHVFDHVLHTAKQVRSQTALFRGKVSLVPLTAELMQEALAARDEPRAVVLGTGQTGQQALRLIRRICPAAQLTVVSRDLERAREVAARHGADGMTMSAFLRDEEPDLDLVACAMRAERPVLGPEWLTARANARNITVLDLAMPRNTKAPGRHIEGLRLVQMDDLTRMSQESRARREAAYDDAMRILEDAVDRVRHAYDLRCHASTLHRLSERFRAVAEERWQQTAGVDASDPRARKWYEQTVRALLHEAAQVVKDPEATP